MYLLVLFVAIASDTYASAYVAFVIVLFDVSGYTTTGAKT